MTIVHINHRESILNTIAAYGYIYIDLPIFEQAALYLDHAGDSILRSLVDIQSGGRIPMVLRPEFTAGAVKRYLTMGNLETSRWYCAGPVFRIDGTNSPTGVLTNEKIGLEIIGPGNTAWLDAEAIAIAYWAVHSCGVTPIVHLAHVGLLRKLIEGTELDRLLIDIVMTRRQDFSTTNWLLDAIDDLSGGCRSEGESVVFGTNALVEQSFGERTSTDVHDRLTRKQRMRDNDSVLRDTITLLDRWAGLPSDPTVAISTLREVVRARPHECTELLDQWENTIDLLHAYGIPMAHIKIAPDLAQNWNYYSGLVFQISSSSSVLVNGGRYDGLARSLGSTKPVPATGWDIDITEIADQASGNSAAIYQPVRLATSPNVMNAVTQLANLLRVNGIFARLVPELDTDADIYIDASGNTWVSNTEPVIRSWIEIIEMFVGQDN
jgi:histidyl-tRNA synthetase